MHPEAQTPTLRRGWTTGACATAATKAAFVDLITGECPATVQISLPNGEQPCFAVAKHSVGEDWASAGVIKDAGDDPDVTHGALVFSCVRRRLLGAGISFRAGAGIGTVTRPGLALAVGEPAINPVPRAMMVQALQETAQALGVAADIDVEISVPGGEELALKTLNGRLGIVGGLSILGTTGIVVPYSCAAWIHSIHRGVDVARASGLAHIAASTGSTSEQAVRQLYGLEETALIEMGDFAGGLLKYVRRHPVDRLTVAGGFAKITKLAQGLLDLHSKAGEVDKRWLAERLREAGGAEVASQAQTANTANEILDLARRHDLPIGDRIAQSAWETAAQALQGSGVALEIAIFDRNGALVGRTSPKRVV